MSKIKTIELKNFKFFADSTEPIEGYNELTDFKLINGENLDLEDLKAKIGMEI